MGAAAGCVSLLSVSLFASRPYGRGSAVRRQGRAPVRVPRAPPAAPADLFLTPRVTPPSWLFWSNRMHICYFAIWCSLLTKVQHLMQAWQHLAILQHLCHIITVIQHCSHLVLFPRPMLTIHEAIAAIPSQTPPTLFPLLNPTCSPHDHWYSFCLQQSHSSLHQLACVQQIVQAIAVLQLQCYGSSHGTSSHLRFS